jgi:hypothetical protein
VAFVVENALALQALRHGDHEVALQRFEAAEGHVADASINDASFYLNRGRLRLQRLELSMARRDFDRCLTLTAASDRPRLGLQFRTAVLITVAASTASGQLEKGEQLLAELPGMRPTDPSCVRPPPDRAMKHSA